MVGKIRDLTGKRFGKLIVIRCIGAKTIYSKRYKMWECKCDCGNTVHLPTSAFYDNRRKSCGCLKQDLHGYGGSRLYRIYNLIKNRCYNKNGDRYKDYGARNIQMCDEWKDSFESFLNWSLENGYAENLTIDRIDNNKGYSPDNCRWVDYKTQANNTRRNVILEYNGERKNCAQWAEILGMDRDVIYKRVRRGWTASEALGFEYRPKRSNKHD